MTSRLALVTGAGRGYGLYVARHLAAAGFKVAVLGRDAAAISAIASEVGGTEVIADIVDRAAVANAIDELITNHATPEVLVNNAGVGGTFSLAWEADPDDWWRTFGASSFSITTRAFLKSV